MAGIKDSARPSFLIPQDGSSMGLTITGTDAVLKDQGYTYNQAGFTYNQAGVFYGGVDNAAEDILPMSLSAQIQQPMNLFVSDIYSTKTNPPSTGKNGPGFLMYVNLT